MLAAHGMGSGKSLSSIAAAVAFGRPVQVLAPTSLTGNYEKEIAKHVDGDLPVNLLSIGRAVAPPPGLVVLDEAHNFRNTATGLPVSNFVLPSVPPTLPPGQPVWKKIGTSTNSYNTVQARIQLLTSTGSGGVDYLLDTQNIIDVIVNSIAGVAWEPVDGWYSNLIKLLDDPTQNDDSVRCFPEKDAPNVRVPLAALPFFCVRRSPFSSSGLRLPSIRQ